jgi:hypothetical protein
LTTLSSDPEDPATRRLNALAALTYGLPDNAGGGGRDKGSLAGFELFDI